MGGSSHKNNKKNARKSKTKKLKENYETQQDSVTRQKFPGRFGYGRASVKK
jgi:hypothetical protein